MPHVLDPNKICTDAQYQAAFRELDALSGSDADLVTGHRADELIRLIEDFEGSMRFVPDWSDEPFHRVAA
jgi:hypothetical protein